MLHGHLQNPDSHALLLAHPVWAEAFNWLKSLPENPRLGTHPIRGDEMFARVMEYDTKAPEQCKFESHRKYIDLQYTLRGAELIAWKRSDELAPAGPYDEPTDLQFYKAAPALTQVHQLPGHFVIFFPSDAHLPQIADGVHRSVYKAVIKVGVHLLANR